MIILITIFLGDYLPLRLVVISIKYALLKNPTIIFGSVEAQFHFLALVCPLKYYFIRLRSRLLFKSFQDLAFSGYDFAGFD